MTKQIFNSCSAVADFCWSPSIVPVEVAGNGNANMELLSVKLQACAFAAEMWDGCNASLLESVVA